MSYIISDRIHLRSDDPMWANDRIPGAFCRGYSIFLCHRFDFPIGFQEQCRCVRKVECPIFSSDPTNIIKPVS